MKRKAFALVCSIAFACLITAVLVAQQTATEAPTGFTTPTVIQIPDSQSSSNGIPELMGDSLALDEAQFERVHDPSTGLGPVYNAASCSQCHQNGVTGAASQFTELRVGHLDANGNFVNPTIAINEGAASISGHSIRAAAAEAY